MDVQERTLKKEKFLAYLATEMKEPLKTVSAQI